MRELFEKVLALQLEHSSQNTPAMVERGKLGREPINGIPLATEF